MSTIEWLALSAAVVVVVILCVIVLASLHMASECDEEAREAFEEKFGGEK